MVQRKKSEGQVYIVVASADENPKEWLRERQKLLTATDLPSILGVPGARSALETWYQKKDALMGRAESEATLAARKAGHDFEDFNALMFSKAADRHVERSQELMRSARHPWLGCTLDYEQREHMLDRLIENKFPLRDNARPLELKNAGSHAADEMWPFGGEPHLTWQIQVHVQMTVMDVEMGSLSAWLGSPFVHHRWCDIERDSKLEELILEEGRAFWKSLKRKTPPKDNPAVALEVLRRLAPERAKHKVISLPAGAGGLNNAIITQESIVEHHKRAHDVQKEKLDTFRGEMAQLIGEYDGGRLKDGTVWMFKHVHVPAHNVGAHSYRKLNRVSAQASKPKRTTWKTSK